MKIERLETHDRLLHLKKTQSEIVQQGAEDCLKKNPLSLAIQELSPYVYLFAHARTVGLDEKMKMFSSGKYKSFEEIPEKIMYWDPRLGKPEAQPNSYLFRAKSKTDIVEVCWILPPEETWKQTEAGNITEHNTARWSIDQYLHNKKGLEAPFPDDFPEEKARLILKRIIDDKRAELRRASSPIITLD